MSNEQEKLEKQNRKLRKKNKSKGKIIAILLIILILIAALVFLLDKFAGLFGGKLSGIFFKESQDKEGSPSASTSVTTTVAPEDDAVTEQTTKTVVEITVSGGKYTMDGSDVTVQQIADKVKSIGVDKASVHIKEDTSTTDDQVEILSDALAAIGFDKDTIIEEKAE